MNSVCMQEILPLGSVILTEFFQRGENDWPPSKAFKREKRVRIKCTKFQLWMCTICRFLVHNLTIHEGECLHVLHIGYSLLDNKWLCSFKQWDWDWREGREGGIVGHCCLLPPSLAQERTCLKGVRWRVKSRTHVTEQPHTQPFSGLHEHTGRHGSHTPTCIYTCMHKVHAHSHPYTR